MPPGSTAMGQWTDYACVNNFAAMCQFFPLGEPKVPVPLLPRKAGCKEGWWPFAGYCYKLYGFSSNIWNSDDFVSFVDVRNCLFIFLQSSKEQIVSTSKYIKKGCSKTWLKI